MGTRDKRGNQTGTQPPEMAATSQITELDSASTKHAGESQAAGRTDPSLPSIKPPLSTKRAPHSPYSGALSLLAESRLTFASLYLLLVLPRLALTLFSPSNPGVLIALRLAERLIELGVLLAIVHLALAQVNPLQKRRPKAMLLSCFIFFAVGLISWVTLLCPSGVIPLEILWTAGSPGGIGPALFMALPAGFVWYIHYYWSFTLPLPGMALPERISLCRELVARDPWSPIKSVLAPSALQFLPVLLLLAPYPDGRSLGLCLLADLFSGVQWLLCSLLTTSFGLHLLSEAEWQKITGDSASSKETFHRHAQLTSEGSFVARSVEWLLPPRRACQILGICTLLWAANVARVSGLPPSPSLKLERAWVDEQQALHLDLEASDPEFNFRGFRPLQFRVTGPNGEPVWAAFPHMAMIEGAPTDVRVFFPVQSGPLSLQLIFIDQRLEPKPETSEMHLWYGGTQIAALPKPHVANSFETSTRTPMDQILSSTAPADIE